MLQSKKIANVQITDSTGSGTSEIFKLSNRDKILNTSLCFADAHYRISNKMNDADYMLQVEKPILQSIEQNKLAGKLTVLTHKRIEQITWKADLVN